MTALTCPTPVMHYDQIVMGHGSGGQMTDDLIQHIFAPAFSMTENLGDAAVLDLGDRG
ncbi:MAG: hydrogenase expression/formation protein HypE, partial [Candidatus Latescibacteria bacterium]|nr:hydrogenase expression/formation protein HypE [Candidatus Latescibacterota bacterium]